MKNDKSKKQMMIDIRVSFEGKTQIVQRSYDDFKGLCYQLKKSHDMLNDFKFPHKRFFSVKSVSDTFKERKAAINELIKKLTPTQELLQDLYYKLFFDLSNIIQNMDKLSQKGLSSSQNIFTIKDNFSEDFGMSTTINTKAKISDFEFLKVIGKGSFGRVFLVLHKEENKYYAIKVLEKKLILERNETRHIMAERAVLMKNVQHPFLVALHYSFQTAEKLYFVLSYMNGGELFFHLQKDGCFIESRARFYAAEIGHALGYLHSMNIIYRDLKPENILLDSEGHIALTDFGLAKQFTRPDQTTNTFCGTPEYLSPEIILKQPYDKSVDWWCYGCVVYEMMSGLPPFYSRNVSEMYDNIVNGRLTFNNKFSIVSKAFLEQLLQKDKNKRLGQGPKDFNELKEHSFLRRINWDDLYNKRIKPPFNPNVSNELDLSNIDSTFVTEEVTESVQLERAHPFMDDKNVSENPFVGFTFVQNNGPI